MKPRDAQRKLRVRRFEWNRVRKFVSWQRCLVRSLSGSARRDIFLGAQSGALRWMERHIEWRANWVLRTVRR